MPPNAAEHLTPSAGNARRYLLVIAGLAGALLALNCVDPAQLHLLLARVEVLSAAQPLATATLFFLVYVLAISLLVPIAAPLAVAAGAVFGLGHGLLIVALGAMFAAAFGFIASRYLFSARLRQRFAPAFRRIDAGIRLSGVLYLFALRLIPAVPFGVISFGMGLTRMPLSRYLVVTMLGSLPNLAVFVNAGAQIGSIDGTGGVLPPGLVLAFVLIGLLPLAARQLLRRRLDRPWAESTAD